MKDTDRDRRTTLSAAISLALATSGAAYAQAPQTTGDSADDAPAVIEEIVVSGFRRSLLNSQDLKQDSESIVEAVSAEDIGKLPDVSIAEALSRLPGLATQRLNGRSQVISVRGLAPDFTTALLNGRQQVSSGDNRSVEFDQYPSELLSSAVVYKTPDAALVGQGLAGTVDMRTIRPLQYGRRAIVGNARYEWNGLSALNSDADDSGERFTLSYIDQFADDTVGVAVGFSHINTPTQGERFNSWGYATTDNGEFVIGGAKPFVQSNTLKRDAVMGVLEYVPSDTFSTSLDVFYSDFNEEQLLRGIELPLQWSSASLRPGYTVEDNLVTSGVFDNVMGVIRSDLEERDSELFALGWNTNFAMGDTWRGVVDISYSKNDRVDQILENYSGYTGGPDSMAFTTGPSGTVFTPTVDYTDTSNLAITNLQGWGSNFVPGDELGQKGYYKQPASKDELTQIRLSADRPLNGDFFSSMEFGVSFDSRDKDKTTEPEYYFALPGATPAERSFAPLPSQTTLTNLGFLGIPAIVGYDPLAVYNSGTYNLVPAVRADVAAKRWGVSEDVITSFAKVGVDSSWGDVPVTGNVGVQLVYTDQKSDALSADGEGADLVTVPVSGGKDFWEVLPSVNLSFEVGDRRYVRVGLARTMARPRMDELRASSEFSLSTEAARLASTDPTFSPWSGDGGNPELDPWIANQLDVAYEQYFSDGLGYFSVAAFYKDLDSYVVKQDVLTDFSNFPTGSLDPQLDVGFVSSFVNGKGGSINGFELAFSVTGEMFTPVLDGFGLLASASFTSSSIDPPNTPNSQLPGLSEDVYNMTFFYEKGGFSGRVSGRYRSDFLGELAGFDAQRTQRFVQAETLVDAQISYTFEQGALAGLTLLAQGNNLTDEEFVTTDDKGYIIDYQRYGRTFAIGASYKID